MLGSELMEEEPEAGKSTPQLCFSLCSIWCQNRSSWPMVLEIRMVIILGLQMEDSAWEEATSVMLVTFCFWDLFNFEVSSNYTIIIWAFIYIYVTLWLKVKINICAKVKCTNTLKYRHFIGIMLQIKCSLKNFWL